MTTNQLKLIGRLLTGEEEEGGASDEASTVGNYVDRLKLLEAIGDTSERMREDELVEYNEDGSSDPFKAPPLKVAAEDEPGVEAKPEESAATEAPPQKIIRKINGQDVEITDDLIARTMKVGAADVYLEEASRLRNEQRNKQKLPATDVSVKPVEDDLAFYVEMANAIQMGTPEEAAAKLRELVSKPAPVIDEAAISRKIDEKLSFNDAYRWFKNEYKDVVNDPRLYKMACDRDNQLIAAGDKRTFAERFKDSGDYVRSFRDDLVMQYGTPNAQTNTKLERKEAVVGAPKPASVKHNSQQVEEKEESYQDVIAQMKKSRAGPRWTGGSTH